MKKVNVIAVLNSSRDKILMCKRRKNPYKDLYNLVGGKIEEGEDGLYAAYRELEEETGISGDYIELLHLMDFNYFVDDICLEVYFGTLKGPFTVHGDENDLLWMDVDLNFFDTRMFAGEGNIGHILEHIKAYYKNTEHPVSSGLKR